MGFYFGAEIVRDTSHPRPRQDGKEETGERGGVGGVGEGFPSPSLAPTLLLSLTYTFLSLSVHLSLCLLPSLAVNLSLPPPPCPSLLFWAGLQDPPLFWLLGSP